MPFSEKIKLQVKKKAHFRCCLCEKLDFIVVHHIIPESDDGPNTIDNAVALCSNCHSKFGGNPDLRKFIKQKRDFWYEICEKKLKSENLGLIEQFSENLKENLMNYDQKNSMLAELIENLTKLLIGFTSDVKKDIRNYDMHSINLIKGTSESIIGITDKVEKNLTKNVWQRVIEYLDSEIDLNNLTEDVIDKEIVFIQYLYEELRLLYPNVIQSTQLSERVHTDLSIGFKIALEIKKLSSQSSFDQLTGNLIEDLRIGQFEYGIAFGIDMTRDKRFLRYNKMYLGENQNIAYVIK